MDNFTDGGGGLFLASALTSGVTITASTEATDYPASAALDVLYPQHGWRSTVPTTTILVIDVGTEPHCGIYLSRANFGAIVAQTNPTNSWTTPAISQTLSIPTDALLGRRQRMVFWTENRQEVNFRYIRLLIPTQTPDESAGYFTLGLAVPVQSPVEVDLRRPLHLTRKRPILENQLATGREVLRLGERALTLELPWEFAWDQFYDSDGNETEAMAGLAVDEDTPVVVCWDTRQPQLSILAYRRGELALQSQDGIGASMPLIFEEITR